MNADPADDIDSHLGHKYGRWKGYEVGTVDPQVIFEVVGRLRSIIPKHIANVHFCSFELILVTNTFFSDSESD